MTDIALKADAAGYSFDISYNESGFITDEGLQTAVIISLFTDRRLPAGSVHPEGSGDPRGYWGDVGDADGYEWGSLLWTLYRQVITNEVITSCREFCYQSLEWMITDGIAESITVNAERAGTYQISIEIEIVRQSKQDAVKYSYLWDGQALAEQKTIEEPDNTALFEAINRWYYAMNFTIPGDFNNVN